MANQEAIIAALRIFSARLDTLQNMDITDLLLLPDWQKHYERALEDAYTALANVKTALDELAQELELQHERFGEAIEQFAVE